MCCGVRCTLRRATRSSRILARVRTARRNLCAFFPLMFRPSLLLGFLQRDLLARVAHALALVRLWRTKTADLGCNLAHLLAIDALDQDFGLARRLDRDALGDRKRDWVRETEGQIQHATLDCRAIADTNQFELAVVAFAHSENHVREMCARRAGDGVDALGTRLGDLHEELLVFLFNLDAGLEGEREVPLRALYGNRGVSHGGSYALWQLDGFTGNTGHGYTCIRKRHTALRRPGRWRAPAHPSS